MKTIVKSYKMLRASLDERLKDRIERVESIQAIQKQNADRIAFYLTEPDEVYKLVRLTRRLALEKIIVLNEIEFLRTAKKI